MTLAGLDFKHVHEVHYAPGYGIPIKEGDWVIARTARGKEMGRVVALRPAADQIHPVSSFVRRVLKSASDEDHERESENRLREKKAFFIAARKIEKLALPMKLISVHYLFDHSRILFFFKATHRVDFRQLVRELASVFRTRIELRQIGVRDEAKIIGGVGDCGRELCCTTFLRGFAPITVRMAKVQFHAVNPSKITGQCGRLKCCIAYEYPFYEEVLKGIPPAGYEVEIDGRHGRLVKVNLFEGSADLVADDGSLFSVPLDMLRDPTFAVDAGELRRLTDEERALDRELSDTQGQGTDPGGAEVGAPPHEAGGDRPGDDQT